MDYPNSFYQGDDKEHIKRQEINGAKSGTVFVDMSTISSLVSGRVAKVAEKIGIQYLRAPVSVSTGYAEKGIIPVLASGPKDSYDNCMDIFRAMSKKTFYVGSREEARYLKLLLNMMVGITSAMTAEALIFGERAVWTGLR